MTRRPRQRVNFRLSRGNPETRIEDNFVKIHVTADNYREALLIVGDIVRNLLLHLSFDLSHFFTAWPVQVTSDERKLYRYPSPFTLAKVIVYNLDGLRAKLRDLRTGRDRWFRDARLALALEYYNKALYFAQHKEEGVSALNPEVIPFSPLRAEVYLSYWKAITTILGDPTNEGSRYQKFYRRLGFGNRFTRDLLKHLRRVRDDYDVAHSPRDLDRRSELTISDFHIQVAARVATAIIGAYRQYILG